MRPLVVATCDLDRALVRGLPGFEAPIVLGHEFVAEVVDVGDAVSTVEVGQVVAVSYQISCGHCRMCHRALTNACRNAPKTATYGLGGGDWGGALADLVRVPHAEAMLAAIPDGVSLQQAASASDNVNDAYRCVAPQLAATPGAPVLVMGTGSIPVMAADSARRLGGEAVHVYTTQRQVADACDRLDIDVQLVDAWPERVGNHPITVDCTSDAAGLRSVINSTEPGGICTSASMHFAPVEVPMLSMYMKGITLRTGRTHGAAGLRPTLDAIAAGHIDPMVLAPERAAWVDAPAALFSAELKTLIDANPQGSSRP